MALSTGLFPVVALAKLKPLTPEPVAVKVKRELPANAPALLNWIWVEAPPGLPAPVVIVASLPDLVKLPFETMILVTLLIRGEPSASVTTMGAMPWAKPTVDKNTN